VLSHKTLVWYVVTKSFHCYLCALIMCSVCLATIQLQAYGPKGRGEMKQSKETFTEVHVVAIFHMAEVQYYLYVYIYLIANGAIIIG